MSTSNGHQPRPTQPKERATLALEQKLEEALQNLLEMGICASDVQESALESWADGAANGYPGGLVGMKVAQTIERLDQIYSIKDTVSDILIPLEVVNNVDAGQNPHKYTRDFAERVAGENMYTNGMISAVTDYRELLNSELLVAFPELAPYLPQKEGMEGGAVRMDQS
ncbi:mediator of RNA polymerase II transcription subunit 10, partial [Phenoliferia sp. Uapishka_3]